MKNLIILFLYLFTSFKNNPPNVVNAGKGGDNSTDLLHRIDKDAIKKKPDIVIIMVGTNDMLNPSKKITQHEYHKNLKKITKKLRKNNIRTILCSPPTVDTIYLSQRHHNHHIINPNLQLSSMSTFLGSLSKNKQIDFIDINSIFREMGLPKHNEDEYIRNVKNSSLKDGIHPTIKGYTLIATHIFNHLVKQKMVTQNMKIVCIGDSITYGEGLRGVLSLKDKTYPAQLETMINHYLSVN